MARPVKDGPLCCESERVPEDDISVPEHVAVDVCHKSYITVCLLDGI